MLFKLGFVTVLLVLVTSCLATQPTRGSPADASAPSTVSADQARQFVDMLWPNAPILFRETEIKRITGSNQTADKLLRLAKPAQTEGLQVVNGTYNPTDLACKQGPYDKHEEEQYGEYEHQNHNKGGPDVDYQDPDYDQHGDKGPYRGYLTRFWAKDGRYAGEHEKRHDYSPHGQMGSYHEATQPSNAPYVSTSQAYMTLIYNGNPTDSGVIDYSFSKAVAQYYAQVVAAGPTIQAAEKIFQVVAAAALALAPAEGRPYMVINGPASYPTRVTIWGKLSSVFPGAPGLIDGTSFQQLGLAPANIEFDITPRRCIYNGPCGTLQGTIRVSSPFPDSITAIEMMDRCWYEGRVVRAECVITPGQATTC